MKRNFSKSFKQLLSLVVIFCVSVSCILSGCSSSEDSTTANTTSINDQESTSKKDSSNTSDNNSNNNTNNNSGNSHITSDGSYDFSIYDDATVYTDDQKKIQEDFDSFLSELLVDEISSSYVSIATRVEHPENYGITINDISFGDNSLESILAEDDTLSKTLDELHSYNRDSLDFEQKIIYDTIEATIDKNIILSKYWYYSEVFSPLGGIQSNLAVALSDLKFKNTTDIDRYLLLLADVKNLFDNYFEIERYRSSEYGIFLSSDAVKEVTTQCDDFINAEENVLISNFKERIENCSFLTELEKNFYAKRNELLVNSVVIPAYTELKTLLKELDGTRKYNSLSEYPHGDEYYEALVQYNSSSLKKIEEIYTLCENYLTSSFSFFGNLSMNEQLAIRNISFPSNDTDTILNNLIEKLTIDFPTPVTTNYEVKKVPSSLESSVSLAFYLIPPIDNFEKNIIYINGKYSESEIQSTLAHEGYPGHLYQHTYFNSLNPNPVRYIVDSIGYTEGFAMYAENCSYSYYNFSDVEINALINNSIYGYNLYSYIDLCVNYKGMSYEDISNFLSLYGYDKEASKELYKIALNDPGVYLRYGIGMDLVYETKEACKSILGDNYTDKIFNKYMLEIGSTYFDIIKDRLNDLSEKLN